MPAACNQATARPQPPSRAVLPARPQIQGPKSIRPETPGALQLPRSSTAKLFGHTEACIESGCAASGTPTTAVLAARIAQPQYIALLEVSPEMEDALEAAEARVAVAKKEADKSKSAAATRQSVRQDMRLRAKVRTTIIQKNA